MIKIKVSYTDDTEAAEILHLLQPILKQFKIKESNNKTKYRHLYFNPRKCVKKE